MQIKVYFSILHICWKIKPIAWFSDRCLDRHGKTCKGDITGAQSGIVDRVASPEAEMVSPEVESERDQTSHVRSPKLDLRFSPEVGSERDQNSHVGSPEVDLRFPWEWDRKEIKILM